MYSENQKILFFLYFKEKFTNFATCYKAQIHSNVVSKEM